jgi:hypothetical protein
MDGSHTSNILCSNILSNGQGGWNLPQLILVVPAVQAGAVHVAPLVVAVPAAVVIVAIPTWP